MLPSLRLVGESDTLGKTDGANPQKAPEFVVVTNVATPVDGSNVYIEKVPEAPDPAYKVPFSKTMAPRFGTPVLPISVATPVSVLIEYKISGEFLRAIVKYNVFEPLEAPIQKPEGRWRPVAPIRVVAAVVGSTK